MNLDLIMNWLASNQEIVVWVATISFVAFIASLLMMPWVLVRLPADYFLVNDSASLVTRRSIKQLLVFALKNIVGVLLLVLGILMLFLPGPGLLAILIGLVLTNLPGKKRLIAKLLQTPTILVPINRLRESKGCAPFVIKKDG